MAQISNTFKAYQGGTAACATCGAATLTAVAYSPTEVRVALIPRTESTDGGTFTPKQLYEFAAAAADVIRMQSEEAVRRHARES